ncbi:hypothetical protein F4823DRAFT_558195 [Ustulina deusta]|nr:hypothetical protein F4823DRAFT_558195 [Ustulina deusta]
MSHKAPGAGTKVSAGINAPTVQEGPGEVKPDSLAAESPAFRQANSACLDNQQGRRREGASGSARAPGTSTSYSQGAMSRESGSGDARAAPTYVENQYRRDPSGPHGRNITEDDSIGTEDQAKNASLVAEIGSKDDPSLLAERKFRQANSVAPAQSRAHGAAKRAHSAEDQGVFHRALTDQDPPTRKRQRREIDHTSSKEPPIRVSEAERTPPQMHATLARHRPRDHLPLTTLPPTPQQTTLTLMTPSISRQKKDPGTEHLLARKRSNSASSRTPRYQNAPSDSFFKKACKNLQNKNKAKVIQDTSRLLVPSAETLAFHHTNKHLTILTESVNEGRDNAQLTMSYIAGKRLRIVMTIIMSNGRST